MFNSFFKKLQGRPYKKFIKECQPIVAEINRLEVEFQGLSEADLQAKTAAFKARVQEAVDAAAERHANASEERREEALMEVRKQVLDDLLPEAFAVVKNGARRLCGREIEYTGTVDTWNMVHFDVQLMGGVALHRNMIAEMATGEGKTLVATLPLYLNALAGLNAQCVTVNDYLARRDSEWMGALYQFLGLSVGCIQSGMDPAAKREMYERDITYGTASEFGFDYLRDNGMATRKEHQVQRAHWFCIIDEVDSILVDEARTPLIISGPMQEDSPLPFDRIKPVVKKLVREQERLCNTLVSEAKKLLEANPEDEQARLDAMSKLWQVKTGMPRNRTLMRMQEEPRVRKELDKFDLEITGEFNKEQRYALKEELFFTLEEKNHQADLTEKGRQLVSPDNPNAFVLLDLPTLFNEIEKDESLSAEQKQERKQEAEQRYQQTSEEIHTLSQLMKAYSLYERDQQYVLHEGKVVIVDENTGRMMPGRRWSDGLHQAVEAKEGVQIEKETKTYATITIQNYFRLYEKLSGMTGTAETEAGEFFDIYGLKVMVIPTHRPNIRIDENDIVYKTRREKYNAVIVDIQEANSKGQPVLVGTASVEASEVLSRMLKRAKIPHTVLNAKFHQQEAEIVSRAGQRGAVTIATNMAGRGTDIKLGEGVKEAGGLLVLGTERHESRRIDRQLRGRCSRQGDPGRTKFFVSLEDNLMRLFANAGAISKMLDKSFVEGEPLSHPMLNWSIENAQKKVEQQNYSMRKRTLQYDDVLNKQREVVYGIRNDAIHSEKPRDILFELIEEEVQERLLELPAKLDEDDEGEIEAFLSWLNLSFPVSIERDELVAIESARRAEWLLEKITEAYDQKAELEGAEAMEFLERSVIIRSIDRHWQDHLTEMDELRRSVGLRGYGQKDPLNEYKSEAYGYFEEMMSSVRSATCKGIFRTATNVAAFNDMLNRMNRMAREQGPANMGDITLFGQAAQAAAAQRAGGQQPASTGVSASSQTGATAPRPGVTTSGGGSATQRELPKIEPVKRETPKIGRNDTVTIRKGPETKTMKFKKAEPLLESGWQLVEK
ncbi:MAG: preprotein translocase subunit SecA [Verrucomicrobiota bacterium]